MAHNRSILDTTATLDLVTFIEATYDHLFATGSNISTDLKKRIQIFLGNLKKKEFRNAYKKIFTYLRKEDPSYPPTA